jgi:hypothetical protein
MQPQNLNMVKSLYTFYETLPEEVQQIFLQEILKNHLNRLVDLTDCSTYIVQDDNQTDEQQKRTIEIYDAYRDELRKRQLSNTENYDKTILSLSSSALALSLTAIKFAIPLATANYLWLIHWSWWLFGITISICIIAYWISNNALDKQLTIAEKYYLKGKKKAFKAKNWWSIVNNWLNITAGLTFLMATALVIFFVTFNI